MEQTKRCPYCGEEIIATAKKCRYCGEWLVEPSDEVISKKPVIKESSFDSKYLYNSNHVELLFWLTILGSLIQAVHQSGINVSGYTFRLISIASSIPEVVGNLIHFVGDICFIILLMRVFSNFHKPLKGWFITYIVLSSIITLISLVLDDTQNDTVNLSEVLFGFVICSPILIPIILLPIMIISNYEGKIKTLGWIFFGYHIASIIVTVVVSYIVPIVAFFIIFLMDFFFYIYLKNILIKD